MVFDNLLRKLIPKLWKHLKIINLECQTYLVEWFYTVFCRHFDMETTVRIWDLVMQINFSVIFKAALIILEMIKK